MFKLPGHRRRAALRLLQYDVDTLRKANVELTRRLSILETAKEGADNWFKLETFKIQVEELLIPIRRRLSSLLALINDRRAETALIAQDIQAFYKLLDIAILNASRHAKVHTKKSQGTRKK